MWIMFAATWFLGYRTGFTYLLQQDLQNAVDTSAPADADATQDGGNQVLPDAPDLD
jgi:hypothetical protein